MDIPALRYSHDTIAADVAPCEKNCVTGNAVH
ncbi:MAG: hypothetical protein QOD51_2494, partial [Candidatus Eremiobacteraeota bacterium]|nr:hypothetical protein [Candidatus Eremiobacteraeota bacterium]